MFVGNVLSVGKDARSCLITNSVRTALVSEIVARTFV